MTNQETVPEIRLSVAVVAAGLLGLGALVALIGGTPDQIRFSMPIALGCVGLAAVALLLSQWQSHAGAWFLCLSLAALLLWLRLWLALPGSLLLPLPTALAVVMLGRRAGAVVTALILGGAALLWLSDKVDGSELSLAAGSALIIYAMLWATFQPMRQLMAWSWEHYRSAQDALEEVRTSRSRLYQTLEELAHANRQLELLNRRLAAATDAAEAARKAKTAFVANVSHEFRTPLNMIIGLSDLLLETPHIYGPAMPPLLLEDLEIVRRNSQHLLSMVNDVLDLSQIEAAPNGNPLALHRTEVDLAALVERAVEVVQPLLAKKRVRIEVQQPLDLAPIFCDGTRVRQVIVNLLSNAARHTEGGRVAVEINPSDHWVTVCVRDTGSGIPPEEVAHIFEPFYRGTFGARRSESGSGLGLSVSRHFIRMHKGDMWLESQVGEGSAFYFRLPIQPPPAAESGPDRWLAEEWHWFARTEPAQLPPGQARPRVVIWDSDPDLQAVLARYQDQTAYDRVESLAAALASIDRLPAQAIIINAASPRLLLEQMGQAQQLWHDLPLIGCSLPPKLSHVLAAGARGQLLKPVTQADLNGVLDQIEPPPRTTLLVDDDEDGRRLFTRMLLAGRPEMQVVTAATGAEALEQMERALPDLLLLDIMLPDIDGWEVLSRKMQTARLRAIPTYLLSAQDPNREPLATPLIAVAMGGQIPLHRLLRCAQIMPRILTAADEIAHSTPA